MSHFTQVRVDLRDESLLIRALHALFGEAAVEVHADLVPIQGYYAHQRCMAHLVVRRNRTTYRLLSDLGFVRLEDGAYRAVLDDMNQEVVDRIRQRYAIEAAKAQAAAEGWLVGGEEIDPDGAIRLIMQPVGTLQAQVAVSAAPNGDATVHVQGIAGSACLPLTHGVVQALGRVVEERLTDEAFLGDDDADTHARVRVQA